MLEEGGGEVVETVDGVLGEAGKTCLDRAVETFNEVLTETCLPLMLGEIRASHRDVERRHMVAWVRCPGIRWEAEFLGLEVDVADALC